ncbi:hypothetical protein KAF25_001626 [Fusarium avenaceum]|uniref:BZIP domain-containing protein n=1 Tax=Fusarium avenaceum TaxID=40199 RepID=A0A9P7KR38_9HYPO|nr:hypothetical protein KAF25_001626 [Fusarium avenaceum]
MCTRKANAMTPEKLAQKRASDREAQRKIRARTKEYIDRLEKEIEQLKSQKCRDQKWRDCTIQSLLRRNEAMEKELVELKQGIELLEKVPHSDDSVSHRPQITEPVAYSTLPLDENNHLAGDEASCYPQGSQFLMNNNGITEYTRLQNPSSSDQQGSESSAHCPEPSIMPDLVSTGCDISYDPAALYTAVAITDYGYFQSGESTYCQDTARNSGNIATNSELNSE